MKKYVAVVLVWTLLLTVVGMFMAVVPGGGYGSWEYGQRAYTVHSAIVINNNTDMVNFARTANLSGDGSAGNPYVIRGMDIDANGTGNAIFIGNTTYHITIEDCYLHNTSAGVNVYSEGAGITLYNATNITVVQNRIDASVSIYVYGSSGNVIENNTIVSGVLYITASSLNNRVVGNLIESGLQVDSHSDSNYIVNNTVYASGNDGILISSSSSLYISGNHVSGALYGMYLSDVDGFNISHNTVSECAYGIFMSYSSSSNVLYNNTLTENWRAIEFYSDGSGTQPSNNEIVSNYMKDNTYGVFLERASNDSVLYNTILGGRFGVALNYSEFIRVEHNTMHGVGVFLYGDALKYWVFQTIENNTVNGMPVYYIRNVSSVNISNMTGELIVVNSNDVFIHTVNMTGSSAGVELAYSSRVGFSDVKLSRCRYGLYMAYVSNVFVGNSSFYDDGYGIFVRDSTGIDVFNTTFTNNSVDTLHFDNSNDVLVYDNVFNGSKSNGIYTGDVDYMKIFNNSMANCKNAVYMDSSSHVDVFHNTIVNGSTGITGKSTNNINVSSNDFEHYWVGLYFKNNMFINVTGNRVNSSGALGVWVDNSVNTTIRSNVVLNSGRHGIYIRYSANTTVVGNDVYRGSWGVIYFIGVENTTLINNTVGDKNNDWEKHYVVYVKYGKNTTAVRNTIYTPLKDSVAWGLDLEYGMYFYESTNTVVKNNIMHNLTAGVYLSSSKQVMVYNNTMYVVGEGVVLKSSDVGRVMNNTLGAYLVGVYVGDCRYFNVSENSILNSSGIYLTGNGVEYWNTNNMYKNTLRGKPIYFLKNRTYGSVNQINESVGEVILANCTNVSVTNMTLTSVEEAVEVGFSSNISVSNITFEYVHHAVYVAYSHNVAIEHDYIYYADTGVYATHMSYSEVGNTTVYGVTVAIGLYNSDHNLLANNTIENVTGGWDSSTGIGLSESNYNVILGNDISGVVGVGNPMDWVGIFLQDSLHNMIKDNLVHDNTMGMFISGGNGPSEYNYIVHNLIYNNSNYGVMFGNAQYNHVYNNSFYYNHGSGDVYSGANRQGSSGLLNYWNSTSGYGNYWHDWANNNNTNDQNHDGIVDYPLYFSRAPVSADYYPLKNATYPMPLLGPTPPREVKAKEGYDYINITWKPSLGNGSKPIFAYRVYRNGTLIGTVSPNVLWYNDTKIKKDVSYKYYVVAVSEVCASIKSNVVTAHTLDLPGAPIAFHAYGGDGYVCLYWSPPNSSGSLPITEYKVYRNGTLIAIVKSEAHTTEYTYEDDNVINGVTYSYYVTAVSGVGEGPRSNVVQVEPSGAVPELNIWIFVFIGLLAVALRKMR